jgi:hypothetical protein
MSAPHDVPLFDASAAPDGAHGVTGPGGYEWWYFDAESADGQTQIVVIFLQGFIFHPGYIRQYGKYRRRPTKVPPPMPGETLNAYFAVYRDGKVWRQFLTQYPAADCAFSRDEPRVTIGPNTLTPTGDGHALHLTGTPWHLTARGPQLLDETLAADLTFTPDGPPGTEARRFLSRRMTGADHLWLLADPRCHVAGRIACGGETIELNCRGYHDHNYGTAPIGPGLKRWIWGRAIVGDKTLIFHHAEPRDPNLPPELHLVEATPTGHHNREAPFEAEWSKRANTLLRYPATINVPDVLKLTHPTVVEDSPFYLRLTYQAEAAGKHGTAFCEIAYPHRLRWPILGRMIEMSIDKRPLRPK